MNEINFICKKFEKLTVEELYEILHARKEVFALEQEIRYQDLDFIDQDSLHLFIHDNKGKKVKTYLRIIKPGVKYPETSIGRVLTLPEFRGKGLGRLIMENGIIEAKRNFGSPIKIEAQQYLVKFYESLGFESISQPFILEGINHVEMILRN